jgi:RteC protein
MEESPEFAMDLSLLYEALLERTRKMEEAPASDRLTNISACIGIARDTMEQLRKHVMDNPFSSTKDEIHFFKKLKPRFYAVLIYYLKVYKIELGMPTGSNEPYLHGEQKKINGFFFKHLEFIQYLRSGSTHLDEIYFLRGRKEVYIHGNPWYFDNDPVFSTGFDHMVARVLANDRIESYLNDALSAASSNSQDFKNSQLLWTGSKTGLIELIYACQSSGVFNNGEADIRQISDFLQRSFNVSLGNYYRTFQEIRIRKKGRTAFLDQLREKLIERMDHADENPRTQ